MARSFHLFHRHGSSVASIVLVSALGIIATAGFQLVAINGLSPEQFGLLAAFLAILNVVSVGSAATRNSVAVNTAAATPGFTSRGIIRDASFVETTLLGAITAVSLIAGAPLIAHLLGVDFWTVLFTAGVSLPYFYFARALGLLQGAGRTTSVVWWTTGAQLLQLGLVAVVIGLSAGVAGVLLVVLLVAVVSAAASSAQSWNISSGARKLFGRDTVVVLLLTVGFAWMTNADVVLVRAFGDGNTAGAYAAAGVIVKTVLIIPATLSLYLLPRFVGRRHDVAMTRLGVNLTLGITAGFGLLMLAGCWLVGPWVISIVYPGTYSEAATLLPLLAAMWLPWAAAQALLIRITASASIGGLVVFGLAIVMQWFVGWALLPDLERFIVANGAVGFFVFAGLLWIHFRGLRITFKGAS
jgi:O-antigen/teichoic acid export membrane protein